MNPYTHGDGLHLQAAGADTGLMRAVGSIPGVVVLDVASRNGPGIGRLIMGDASTIAWQAPGSSTPGNPQSCGSDGTYLIEDGADTSKWVRIQVYASYLAVSGEGRVFIQDTFNGLGPADVAAANAAAGVIATTTFTLKNVSNSTVTSVLMWLDQTVGSNPGISISSDNITFYTPTSIGDPNALAWASIAAGASVPVYVKRTIAAASPSSPSVLNNLQFSWIGV